MAPRKVLQKSINVPYFLLILFLVIALGIIIIFWSIWRPFCANTRSCEDSLSLNVSNEELGTFSGQELVPPKIDLDAEVAKKPVLGEKSSNGEKHIYVDLTTQTLEAYEGGNLYLKAPVSTGKWGRTPTGEFRIWTKLRATKMSGGSGSDYYYLPNVPYVMFFANDKIPAGRGFGLHGTYWHNNFGHPMSHGCVNLRTVDAEKLYHWVNPVAKGNITPATEDNPGTKITIYGEAPL